uniref:Transposase n=1 Tax=Haemonchus contortus TaxID=6289 RepID=A0A7I4Y8V6_HAECO
MRPSPHRVTIAHLLDEGCSAAEIARRLHINDRTVRRIVAQYRERGHHLPLPKSRRPRTVNVPRIRRVTKKRISRNEKFSMNKIASDLHISRRSVQKIIKCELDLHIYLFFRCQMLSETAKKNKLEKCQKLLAAVRAGRLSDIVWTDEKFHGRGRAQHPKPAAAATLLQCFRSEGENFHTPIPFHSAHSLTMLQDW